MIMKRFVVFMEKKFYLKKTNLIMMTKTKQKTSQHHQVTKIHGKEMDFLLLSGLKKMDNQVEFVDIFLCLFYLPEMLDNFRP